MPDPVGTAVAALRRGALVVYPTDTLVGLGASALNAGAVDRLLAAKGRPSGMPISVAVASFEEVEPWVEWGPAARAVARRLLPGPVTLLVGASRRARREIAAPILGPNGTIGIRVPAHPVARELARRAGPITSTSANLHGAPPVVGLREARRAFGHRVAVYLPLRPPPSGAPSMLVDLNGDEPRFVPRR
jgi:L-threonylcarbamoyladenylate synthase